MPQQAWAFVRNYFSLPAVVALIASVCGCSPAATDEAPQVAPPSASWSVTSDTGLYEVTISPLDGRAVVGAFHEWDVIVKDARGKPVFPARIQVGGGMPGHGHGLPSQPEVTESLGNGRYRIEGMRFNMGGAWVLELAIDAKPGRDVASFNLDIDL